MCTAQAPRGGQALRIKVMRDDARELDLLLRMGRAPGAGMVPILHVARGFAFSPSGDGSAGSTGDSEGCFLSAVVMTQLTTLASWTAQHTPQWVDKGLTFRTFEGIVCALIHVSAPWWL